MNDDTSPFEPEELDELLSAELDGELDAAARDLGLSAAEVSARRRATPGADERRAALAAARDMLSDPAEIDELLAARLRTKAVRAGEEAHASRRGDRSRRRRQVLAAAGGVAAAIAAVVAIAAGMNATKSGTSAERAKSALASPAAPKPTTATTGARHGPAPALGPFSDVHALALSAVSRANAVSSATSSKRVGTTAGTGAAATLLPADAAAPLQDNPAAGSTTKAANSTFGRAETLCPSPPQLRGGDTLVLATTATLSGKPVVVLVFTGNGEHTVVVDDTNCRLVNLQMFG